MNKISFNKRISIVKANVVIKLIEEKDLSKLGSGSSKSGYYNLSTIMSALQPELLKNDLDLDIKMLDTKVIGTWVDCELDSEKTKEVEFDLSRLSSIIKNLERLPQMQNAIQTEGSIKTYFRRYALTAFLNLPATDEIDSQNNNSNGKEVKKEEKIQFLSAEQKSEIAKKDKEIVAYIIKNSTFKSIDEVPAKMYADFLNQVTYYEKKKKEKQENKKQIVTKEDIKKLNEIIEDRKLAVDFWHNAICTMYEISNINQLNKVDFEKFYNYISEQNEDKTLYIVSNKDLHNLLEKKCKQLEEKIKKGG